MPRLTLSSRDEDLLRDAVAATRQVEDDAPVAWSLLESVRRLLAADELYLAELDVNAPRHLFVQRVDRCGLRVVEEETVEEARHTLFWRQYWRPDGCGYPDRTGDFVSVTKDSDFYSDRELTRLPRWRSEMPRHLMACAPLPARGHHLRLLAYRDWHRDFDERERLLVALLRPHLAEAYWTGVRARDATPRLTGRQLELMDLVRQGLTNRSIARRLGLSEATVRTHLNHVYARLGVLSRTEAVDRVYLSARA